MSEFINNSKIRQEQLKEIIKDIHNGMELKEAKEKFKQNFDNVSTDEITQMEHALIEEGMKVEEIQKLCDVHAALFDGSISDIHAQNDKTQIKGHPSKVFLDENKKLIQLIEEEINPYLEKNDKTSHLMLRIGFERLTEIEKHYSRKENLFFPGLEKRNIPSIPQVMWGVDNEIREMFKKVKSGLDSIDTDISKLHEDIKITLIKVQDMITKENNILMPLLLETLSLYDWILADEGSNEIGYFLEKPTESWIQNSDKIEESLITNNSNEMKFDAGSLNNNELNAILNTIPFDMTFVDKFDKVKYFTQGKERIFPRPLTVLGRNVNMCHPPQSVHIVEKIITSFKDGSKDHEDFWIQLHNMFVHIRYYAIRDVNNNYLGTLEVTQDIKPIRELHGEKRLLD